MRADTGATVKCHENKAQAQKHLTALNMNVHKEYVHGTGGILSQPGQGKRKKKGKVTNTMITPKEFATKYALAEKDFSYAQSESWVVDSASSALYYLMSTARSEMYQQESDDSKEIISLMKQLVSFISDQLDEMYGAIDIPSDIMYKEVNAKSELVTTKDATGKWRWTLITSSAFEDRDGEIVSEKALKKDCDQMEFTGEYGELLWWHSDGDIHGTEKEARPYLPLGNCDTSFVYKKLNIESGLYYDDSVGEIFSKKTKEFGASKSFYHLPDEPVDGVYSYIRTKERSILPLGKEANFLTRLFGWREKEMANTKERIQALREKLGDDEADKILQHAKEQSLKAEKLLASKEKKVDPDDDDDDDEDEGKDKEAQGLELAVKEMKQSITDGFAQVTKELTPLKDEVEKQSKRLEVLEQNAERTNKRVQRLMGEQPKNKSKAFRASEDDDTEIDAATELKYKELLEKREKEMNQEGDGSVTDWFMRGAAKDLPIS